MRSCSARAHILCCRRRPTVCSPRGVRHRTHSSRPPEMCTRFRKSGSSKRTHKTTALSLTMPASACVAVQFSGFMARDANARACAVVVVAAVVRMMVMMVDCVWCFCASTAAAAAQSKNPPQHRTTRTTTTTMKQLNARCFGRNVARRSVGWQEHKVWYMAPCVCGSYIRCYVCVCVRCSSTFTTRTRACVRLLSAYTRCTHYLKCFMLGWATMEITRPRINYRQVTLSWLRHRSRRLWILRTAYGVCLLCDVLCDMFRVP